MSESVSYFRIFLSSPGDVPQERDDAEVAINEINESSKFSNHFILKIHRWDDKSVVLPMPVTEIPQKSVDIYMTRPSQCDLVVVGSHGYSGVKALLGSTANKVLHGAGCDVYTVRIN